MTAHGQKQVQHIVTEAGGHEADASHAGIEVSFLVQAVQFDRLAFESFLQAGAALAKAMVGQVE
ncbi:MAG: hypothetical protein L0Y42_07930 [Phycisphaerales bacterium]|nr:hypothetical protein [Phycisphaerales bacterium]